MMLHLYILLYMLHSSVRRQLGICGRRGCTFGGECDFSMWQAPISKAAAFMNGRIFYYYLFGVATEKEIPRILAFCARGEFVRPSTPLFSHLRTCLSALGGVEQL
jgi:hypothetical protein